MFGRLAIPNILTNFLGYMSIVTVTVYAGRLDEYINVAVMGLATTFCRMIVTTLQIGLNAAQETLTSQAFGAGNKRLCGIYLNRGTCILIVFFFLIAMVPFFFTEKILLAIGTEQEVSELSGVMVRLLLPTEFMYGQYDLRKRWLACQRITFVPMVASIISTVMHVPLCYLFVHTAGFGLHGLALANFIKESITLLITMTYCRCRPEIREVM